MLDDQTGMVDARGLIRRMRLAAAAGAPPPREAGLETRERLGRLGCARAVGAAA